MNVVNINLYRVEQVPGPLDPGIYLGFQGPRGIKEFEGRWQL